MDLVQHNVAFHEGYVLRTHLLHSLGPSAPNNFKEALVPTPLHLSRQRWVITKGCPNAPLTFCRTPCNHSLTSKASDSSSNGSSEKERNFAQKKPNTLQRSSSVSQLNIARAAQAADNARLKTGVVSLALVNLLHRFRMFRDSRKALHLSPSSGVTWKCLRTLR